MTRVAKLFGAYEVSATAIHVAVTGTNYVQWQVRWRWNEINHSRHDLMSFLLGLPDITNAQSYDIAPASTHSGFGERVVYGRFTHNEIDRDHEIKTPQQGFDRIHMYMVLWAEHCKQGSAHEPAS